MLYNPTYFAFILTYQKLPSRISYCLVLFRVCVYNQLLYPARQIRHIGQRYNCYILSVLIRQRRERGKRRKFITTLRDDCRPVPGPSRSEGRGMEIPSTAPPPADVATLPSPPWTHALWQTMPTRWMDGQGDIRWMCTQKPSPLTTPPLTLTLTHSLPSLPVPSC